MSAAYRFMVLFMLINQLNASVQCVILFGAAVMHCLYNIFQPRDQSCSTFRDEILLSFSDAMPSESMWCKIDMNYY